MSSISPTLWLRIGLRRIALACLSVTACGAAVRLGAQVKAPLPISILQNSGQVGTGLVFVSPTGPGGLTPLPNAIQGPEIVDNLGRPVWFLQLPDNQLASDFRVQQYQGQSVLTWSQGYGFEDEVPGTTTDVICDSTYTVIATVQAGNGLNADQHEFQLTPQNTALITSYDTVPADLSSVGGPSNGLALEGIAQEIDVATGTVVMEWRSLDHVALTESYTPAPTDPATPFDYFHINSVKLDTDGNLLISARDTSTVYKVDRATGDIIWRLGGKLSDFTLGPGLPFAYQHDAEAVDSTTIRIFDNESNGIPVLPASRVIWVTHDDTAKTATLAKSIQHPAGLSVLAEGSGQTLSNGDTFIDWGILGRFSEFDPNGNMIYDASLASGYGSYRGFRIAWTGAPSAPPTVRTTFNADGTTSVDAAWNGATQVATWSIMAGASPGSLAQVASGPWNGLDTPVTVPGQAAYYQVVGLDATGATLGQSTSAAAPPTLANQPASQTVVGMGTVVFSVTAHGPALTYQWTLNGNPIADGGSTGPAISGATGPLLVMSGVSPADAGSYACVVSSASGSVTSTPAALTVASTTDIGRLINVSARATAGAGSNVLIAGFTIGGPQNAGPQPLLIRASGPALAQFGITGVLPDPGLAVVASANGSQVTGNFDWSDDPQIASVTSTVGAFPWGGSPSLDQATLQTLAFGNYTALVSGQSGDTGVVLEEVYDATPPGTFTPSMARLTNVSARAGVGTGDNILIGGFVVGGSTSVTVLIRASGPALSPFVINGLLADPLLQVYSGTTVVDSNAGWAANPQIAAAASVVGAFAWGTAPTADAAILVTLPPGAYTATVSGASGDTGVALLEVYALP